MSYAERAREFLAEREQRDQDSGDFSHISLFSHSVHEVSTEKRIAVSGEISEICEIRSAREPDLDPMIVAMAQRILELTPDDLAAYRAEVAAVTDPDVADDLMALDLADQLRTEHPGRSSGNTTER